MLALAAGRRSVHPRRWVQAAFGRRKPPGRGSGVRHQQLCFAFPRTTSSADRSPAAAVAVEPTEGRARPAATLAVTGRRWAQDGRAQARAEFAEARRHGLAARHATKLTRLRNARLIAELDQAAAHTPEASKATVHAPEVDESTVHAPEVDESTVRAPEVNSATVRASEVDKSTVLASEVDKSTALASEVTVVSEPRPASAPDRCGVEGERRGGAVEKECFEGRPASGGPGAGSGKGNGRSPRRLGRGTGPRVCGWVRCGVGQRSASRVAAVVGRGAVQDRQGAVSGEVGRGRSVGRGPPGCCVGRGPLGHCGGIVR